MERPSDADFVRRLAPALRRAATIARSLEGRVPNQPKSHEAGVVKQALTDADTASQEVLLEALLESYPDVGLAAEEDTPTVSRFPDVLDPLVIIDPVDGTLHSYLEARGPYATIVGLVREGHYVAGLVALPREGLLFAATRGQGALRARAGGALRPVEAEADGTRVLVSHRLYGRAAAGLRKAGFEPVPACGGAVSIAPLIPGVRAGVRLQRSGIGISIRGRVGALIAKEGGAHVLGDGGREFPLDLVTRSHTLRVATSEEDLAVLDQVLVDAGALD